MRTIMAKTPHDSSFSFSRRNFHWRKKTHEDDQDDDDHNESDQILGSSFSSLKLSTDDHQEAEEKKKKTKLDSEIKNPSVGLQTQKKKFPVVTVSRLRSVVLTVFSKHRRLQYFSGLGTRVVGTLFGYRRGHVHFAFQDDSKSNPVFLIELATPTSGLVREMASGLVRIALECDKNKVDNKKGGTNHSMKLLEEPLWRTYCNGKKCGFAMRRECGPEELKVLKAVEPISMGAGVLPGSASGSAGELMYMRAKFERVIGSRDSEAFYMMNPDGNGGPELSLYLLRV